MMFVLIPFKEKILNNNLDSEKEEIKIYISDKNEFNKNSFYKDEGNEFYLKDKKKFIYKMVDNNLVMKCFKQNKLSYQSQTPLPLLDTICQNYLNLKESKKMKKETENMSRFDFFNSPVNQVTKEGPKVNLCNFIEKN